MKSNLIPVESDVVVRGYKVVVVADFRGTELCFDGLTEEFGSMGVRVIWLSGSLKRSDGPVLAKIRRAFGKC